MAQTLVNVVTVTNLAGGATITVAHGLESNGGAGAVQMTQTPTNAP